MVLHGPTRPREGTVPRVWVGATVRLTASEGGRERRALDLAEVRRPSEESRAKAKPPSICSNVVGDRYNINVGDDFAGHYLMNVGL